MPEALRPMTLGMLLDRTFFLYRKHFVLFAGLVALPHLGLLAVQLSGIVLAPLTLAAFLVTGIALIVWLVVIAVSQSATVVAVSRLHLGREASLSGAFASIKGRVVTISLIMVTYGLVVACGLILLIVPGVLLALMWSLAIPVAVIEGTAVRESLSRSSALTKGHRLRILAIYCLFVVLTYIFYATWAIPIGLVMGAFSPGAFAAPPGWAQIAFPVGQFLTQCLVGPLVTIALSLAYYDERVRKEAFDLEHMMSGLDEATN